MGGDQPKKIKRKVVNGLREYVKVKGISLPHERNAFKSVDITVTLKK